jgi:hypothetical protein
MTATLAPAVLTDAQRVLLAEVFEDATYYRLPDGDCAACSTALEPPCAEHESDMTQAVRYRILAADLGLDQPAGRAS